VQILGELFLYQKKNGRYAVYNNHFSDAE